MFCGDQCGATTLLAALPSAEHRGDPPIGWGEQRTDGCRDLGGCAATIPAGEGSVQRPSPGANQDTHFHHGPEPWRRVHKFLRAAARGVDVRRTNQPARRADYRQRRDGLSPWVRARRSLCQFGHARSHASRAHDRVTAVAEQRPFAAESTDPASRRNGLIASSFTRTSDRSASPGAQAAPQI